MQIFLWILLSVNVVGFLLGMLNSWMRRKGGGNPLGMVLMGLTILGGAVGVEASLLCFDRKAVKENMLLHVFGACGLVIEILAILTALGVHGAVFQWNMVLYFAEHRWLVWYLLAVNLLCFVMFGQDKWRAVRKKWRIPIVTLLGLSFVGGSIGGLIGMKVFHHKTRQNYFTIGLPMMLVMQGCVLLYMMNL